MTYLSKGGIFLNFVGEYRSPVGPLLLQSDGEYLTGLYWNREVPEAKTPLAVFDRTALWLDGYFRGEAQPVEIPLLLTGTAFQKLIWQLLLQVPYGEVVSYGDLAKQVAALLGKEVMSAQAVGQAVGKNPVSILVPCHRCIGSGGKLTGYAGGMDKKIWLLRHEGRQILSDKVI